MTPDQFRIQWLKWQKKYEIKAYRVFNSAIKESFTSLNPDSVTYENYKIVIPLNIMKDPITRAYIDVYTTIGLTHGRLVGFGINRDVKRFNNDLFSSFFQGNVIDWIRDNVGYRIVSVSETIAKRIGRLVEVAAEQGLSVLEMQRYLRQKINEPSFTRYQALRIARTEVGAATNHAATVAADNSGIILEKVWISSKDPRTRRIPKNEYDHLHMDGVTVPMGEKFRVVSKTGIVDYLDNPCDPAGRAGDVINCRCVVAHRPVRDKDGFVLTR